MCHAVQVEVAVAAGIVPGAKAAAAKQQAKGQTLKERLAACRASERDRLTFGKVHMNPLLRMVHQPACSSAL